MKLSEAFEYKGFWWLPSKPDNKVAGVLSYKPGERIRLELIGSFDQGNDAASSFMNKKDEAVIHGQLENAKKVTLLKCYPSGTVNLSSFFPVIRYSCVYCFIGRHYMGMDDEGGFEMTVHYPELSHWCHPGMIRESFLEDKERKGQVISLSFEANMGGRLVNEVELEDGMKLALRAGASLNGDHASLNNRIAQFSWIEISSKEKVTFHKLLSCVYKFEEFLSMATLSVSEVSEITIYDNEYYQEIEDGRRIPLAVSFISSHWRGKNTRDVDSVNFLFDYDTIKEKFGDVMRMWFADKNDMYPVRNNLVDSLEKKRVFSNMDFLILARALDGYCIRSKYNGSTANRMKAVLEKFSDVSKIQRDNIDIEELVDSRDFYAHFMPRKGKKHVLDGFELHTITQKVRRLVICCVLSDLGFGNSEIDSIFRKSYSKYITD